MAAYACRSNVLADPLPHGEAVDFTKTNLAEAVRSDCVGLTMHISRTWLASPPHSLTHDAFFILD